MPFADYGTARAWKSTKYFTAIVYAEINVSENDASADHVIPLGHSAQGNKILCFAEFRDHEEYFGGQAREGRVILHGGIAVFYPRLFYRAFETDFIDERQYLTGVISYVNGTVLLTNTFLGSLIYQSVKQSVLRQRK